MSTEYEYFVATQRDEFSNSSGLSNAHNAGFLGNNCLHIEPCNLICNPSIICETISECGYMLLPIAWESTHGTCDRCPGVGFDDDRCDHFATPPDEGFIMMFSNGEENREEGVIARLTNSINPNEFYRLSFWVQNVGTIDNMTVRLISLSDLVGIVPRPNIDIYVIPEVDENPQYCRTIDSRDFPIVNPQSWHEIIIDFPAEPGNENFDALWIYIHNEENYAFLGIDKFKLEKLSFAETSFDIPGCFDIDQPIQLNAYNAEAVSYSWSGPSGWTGNGSNPTVTNHAAPNNAGEYSLTVTDLLGCENVSSVNVVINDLSVYITSPLTIYPENEVLICENTDFILTATASPNPTNPFPYTYSWNTGHIEQTYSNSCININGLPSMTYEVTVNDENGCSADAEFIVNYYPPIDQPLPINTSPYCQGEDIILSVSNPNPEYEYAWHAYSWNDWAIGFDEDNSTATRPNAQNTFCCNPNPYTSLDYSGEYVVIARDQYGCTASASTNIEVVPDQSCMWFTCSPICENDDLVIFPHSTGTCSHCGMNSSEIIVQGPSGIVPFEYNNSVIIIHGLEHEDSGIYSISVTSADNCSTNVFEIDVSILENPEVTLPHNLSPYCMGQTITITPTHSDFIVSYTWDGPSYGSHDPVAHFTLPAGTSGELPLSLTVTDINGCTASDVTTLYVYPGNAFQVFASSNSPVCQGGSLNLNAWVSSTNNDYSYSWHGPNYFSSNLQNPLIDEVQLLYSGTYDVYVVGTLQGCYGSASIEVLVEDCSQTFNLLCSTRPVTCDIAYNGAVIIEVSEGNPPYLAEIYRNGILLNSQNL
ncbi:MAG: PKD domain-containing protein, partial [Bacteroidales bacterium]|nr:PKD domain-containing protein [Bacteroidales bacterium]